MKDGGPAFPRGTGQLQNGEHEWGSNGMSLRDYFAVHAPDIGDAAMWSQGESSIRIEAARAYRWADAMLAERNK